MMYNGFKGLSTEFISHHAAHYIVPVHVTGSCIESLFSRFMYNANGNLSAVNYETAMSRKQLMQYPTATKTNSTEAVTCMCMDS